MKIAVVMPTLNADRYLVEAVRSILAQTCTAYTLFVIDGGSTDATIDICKALQRLDGRIAIAERPGTTPTQRIDEFLRDSDFDYYFMAHADDVSFPNRLDAQLDVLRAESGPLIVGAWARYWLHEKAHDHDMPHGAGILRYPVGHHDIAARLPFWWCFSVPSIAIDGAQMRASGLKLDNRFDLASDWWFFWEAAKIGPVANIDQPLISYRQHLSGHGARNRERLTQEKRRVRRAIARDIGLREFLLPEEAKTFLDLDVEYDRLGASRKSEADIRLLVKLLDFSPKYITEDAWRAAVLDLLEG